MADPALAEVGSLWGYAIAGYVVTGSALALYAGSLFARARRARRRAEAIAERRRDSAPLR
jgi:hypothetical protein